MNFFTIVPDRHLDPKESYVLGHPGSASGFVSQKYGSEDPDPHKMSQIPNTA